MTVRRSDVWWLPEDPSEKIAGTLVRADESWRLELVGTLPDQATDLPSGLALLPATSIYGLCRGVRYTLAQCHLSALLSPRFPTPAGGPT